MSVDLFLKVLTTLRYLDPALRAALKEIPGDGPAAVLISNALTLIESTSSFFMHPRAGAPRGVQGDPSQRDVPLEQAFPPDIVRMLPDRPWTEESVLRDARAKLEP